MLYKFSIALYLFLLVGLPAHSQDSLDVSLLTFGPGQDLYSCYGHTGIRIQNHTTKKDLVFNYGTFNFNQGNFYWKFIRGKLPYTLSIQNYGPVLRQYNYEQRHVYEQLLDLSSKEENAIYKSLIENYKPENREYLYDFFFDNCSTRPRDIFVNALPDLQWSSLKVNKTFRDLINEYNGNKGWADFGIDLIIGSVADRKATDQEAMFLPDYLQDALNESFVGSNPTVASQSLVLDYIPETVQRKTKMNHIPFYVCFFLLIIEMVVFFVYRNKASKGVNWYDTFWWILLTIGGIILAFMWWGTDHIATKQNYNLLWMHPMYILMLLKSNSQAKKIAIVSFMLFIMIAGGVHFMGFQIFHSGTLLLLVLLLVKISRHLLTLKQTSV